MLIIQMTWADVSWLALYCRKLKIAFMSVNVPTDFSDEIIFGWKGMICRIWMKENTLLSPLVFPVPLPFPVWRQPNGAFWRNSPYVEQEVRRASSGKVQTWKELNVGRESMLLIVVRLTQMTQMTQLTRRWHRCGWHSLGQSGVDRTWVRQSSVCWLMLINQTIIKRGHY